MIKKFVLLVFFCHGALTSTHSLAGERIVSKPEFDPTPVKIESVRRNASPRPITSMDLLTLRDIKGMQISPDGKKVVFALVQAVYETNSYRSGLFVADTAPGSLPVSLGTAGPPRFDVIGQISRYLVAWSPDGQWITCLMNQNGSWQIWRWPAKGGKPEQLTHNAADVEEYQWSQDGNRIVFTTAESIDAATAKKTLESGILYDGSIRTWGHDTFPQLMLEAKPKRKQIRVYEVQNRKERSATTQEQAGLNKSGVTQLGPG